MIVIVCIELDYRSAVYTVHFVPGWKAVEEKVWLPHNLETTPIQIKTDSPDKTGAKVNVYFYKADPSFSEIAGVFSLYFDSPLQYQIGQCSYNVDLPTNLVPSEVNKVWTITKLPGPRLTLHCNGVKVLDVTLSDDICVAQSDWKVYWEREIGNVYFYQDTASDEYRAAPGNSSIILNITRLIIIAHPRERSCKETALLRIWGTGALGSLTCGPNEYPRVPQVPQ